MSSCTITNSYSEFVTDVFFCFLRYAVSLRTVLPTIGQYSIDITIKYNFKCYDALEALIANNWAQVF